MNFDKIRKFFLKNKFFILIILITLIFFWPIFKGYIPFPGDLLVSKNPYSTVSFLGYAPGGFPNKAQGSDVITEIYPWRYFSIGELKKGSFPFWNPYNFSGNPQMANFQTAIFYPLNFLYFLLPFNLSWTFLIMLQPILAGIFMYLFLKKGVGVSGFASFIGGLSFSFCSYMSVWVEYGNIGHTFIWLPLALLFTKYFFRKINILNFLGLIFTLSFSILAGYIQGAFYIYALCLIYYFYFFITNKKNFEYRKSFIFIFSLLLPLLITAFQILPTITIFLGSTRGAYTLSQIEKNLTPVFTWITIFFSDFFGNPATRNYWINGTYIERVMYPGAMICFFAIYAVLNRAKLKDKNFFVAVGVVSLLLATNLPFIKFFYLLPIPVISTTIPTRELSIFIFSLIVLGAIGIDYFEKEKEFNKKFAGFYILFAILICLIVGISIRLLPSFSEYLKISLHNLILPTFLIVFIVIAALLKKKNKKISFVIITLLVMLDLFYFFNKITPFSNKNLIYPQTPVISYLQEKSGINRYWGLGSGYIQSNFQTFDRTYSPEGNDPLHISRYGELLASSGDGKIPKVLPRPDANVYPGFGKDDLKNNFYRQRMLNLLGVKFVLNQTQIKGFDHDNIPDTYGLVWENTPVQIYENKQSLPRFFITDDYIVAQDKKQVLDYIFDKNINLGKTLVLEKRPNIEIGKNIEGTVRLISYKPNNVIFKISNNKNSLFFLSDNYYPEWEVKIDGRHSEILLADYTFRAVAVSKGQHIVEYSYNPKSFYLGLIIGLIGLLLAFGCAIIFIVKNKKNA